MVTRLGAIGSAGAEHRLHTDGVAAEALMEPARPAYLERTLQLTQLRDWCMQRLSTLSLEWRMGDARALTAEHLEALEVVDAQRTLWMTIEAGP
jgi:hypothetical protein